MKKEYLENAEAAAKAFFDAWKNRSFTEMADACQPSWRNFIRQDAGERMKQWFGMKQLTAYEIRCKTDITQQINRSKEVKSRGIKFEAYVTVQVKIEYVLESKTYKMQVMANAIMEQGVFKINPTSVLKEVAQ